MFVYFPAVIALGLAFFHFHLRGAETTWAGLQNFRDALEYRIFWIAVRNTVLYAAVMIPLTVSLALLIAALLTRQSRFYGALRTAVLLPYVTPVVATSIGWLWIFNPQYGVANSALHALGLPELPWLQSTTWALPSVAIYTLWHGLGFDVIVACAALAAVPRQVVEAARVDGAGLMTELTRVILPIVVPGLAATALICMIFSWNEFFFAVNLTATRAGTMPVFLVGFITSEGLYWAKLAAAASLASLPVVLLGWIAQKQLVRGLALGAVK